MNSIKWDGQRISKPGIYSGIPLDRYHAADICDGPSISSSPLRTIWNKSVAHAWAQSPLNPKRVEPATNEAFILGRAAHHLICGEVGFSNLFIIRPETLEGEKWNGNRLPCKAWMKQQAREGRTVLTVAQVEQIKGMAVSLGNNTLIQSGILNGLIERSMFWKDPETNFWLKARPDAMPSDSGDYGDLKTTQSVLYRDLQKALGDFGYHQQGGLVLEGARALGLEASSFSLIWVEKEAPFCTRVTTLKDDDLARGTKMNHVALRQFVECFKQQSFPGPGDDRADAEYIDLADWRREQIDERLRLEMREAA